MYIPNYDTQSYPFCRLQLVVEAFGHSTTNENLIKVSKVVKPTNMKIVESSVINSQMSPPSLNPN